MSSKRGNGEGTIYKRKNGSWCAAITIGREPETGKLKRKFFYGKTRSEVAAKLNKSLNQLNQGTFIEPSKVTLGQWLDVWFHEYKKPSVRPTTFTSYEYLIRVHIKPTLGHIQLKNLKPHQLQSMYMSKFKNGRNDGSGGLSARTVRYIHIIIHQALEQAVKNNLIIHNVSKATTLPRKQTKEMRVLTVEEQNKFLNVIREERLEIAFILALATGARLGELLGLRWKDVDLDGGIVKITQALSRVRNFDKNIPTKSKLIFQEPKTKSGKRQIPLPKAVIRELIRHKRKQNEEKLLTGELYEENDLVICTEMGKPTEPRNLDRKFKSLVDRAGLKSVNFHALRHTYATRLLEANEHPKVVQEILGHSSISMTLDIYSHVMPEVKMAAASKINSLFERQAPFLKEGTQNK